MGLDSISGDRGFSSIGKIQQGTPQNAEGVAREMDKTSTAVGKVLKFEGHGRGLAGKTGSFGKAGNKVGPDSNTVKQMVTSAKTQGAPRSLDKLEEALKNDVKHENIQSPSRKSEVAGRLGTFLKGLSVEETRSLSKSSKLDVLMSRVAGGYPDVFAKELSAEQLGVLSENSDLHVDLTSVIGELKPEKMEGGKDEVYAKLKAITPNASIKLEIPLSTMGTRLPSEQKKELTTVRNEVIKERKKAQRAAIKKRAAARAAAGASPLKKAKATPPPPPKLSAWKVRAAKRKAADAELAVKRAEAEKAEAARKASEPVLTVDALITTLGSLEAMSDPEGTQDKLHHFVTNGGDVEAFVSALGSDSTGALGKLWKLEGKVIFSESKSSEKQTRLGPLLKHMTPAQLTASAKIQDFRTLAGQTSSGQTGGITKTIVDSVTPEQLGAIVAGLNDEESVGVVKDLLTRLTKEDKRFEEKITNVARNKSQFCRISKKTKDEFELKIARLPSSLKKELKKLWNK